jgi:hypothetical protein
VIASSPAIGALSGNRRRVWVDEYRALHKAVSGVAWIVHAKVRTGSAVNGHVHVALPLGFTHGGLGTSLAVLAEANRKHPITGKRCVTATNEESRARALDETGHAEGVADVVRPSACGARRAQTIKAMGDVCHW